MLDLVHVESLSFRHHLHAIDATIIGFDDKVLFPCYVYTGALNLLNFAFIFVGADNFADLLWSYLYDVSRGGVSGGLYLCHPSLCSLLFLRDEILSVSHCTVTNGGDDNGGSDIETDEERDS